MINSISFPDFGIAILLALTAGLLYAAVLYFRENKFANPPSARLFLAFLRGFSVALIVILLFSPVIKTVREEVKPPLVVMADDVSASVAENAKNAEEFQAGWEEIRNAMSKNYAVRSVNFAGQVSEEKMDSVHRNSTNLSGLFRYIDDNYADQNVGAVLISTDGIFNEGNNPLYMDAVINSPLYIVAQGDTTRYKDLMISDVFFNKIAYLGDKFTLQIDIKAYHAANTTSRLVVENMGKNNVKKRWEENIVVTGKEFFTTKTVEMEATEAGIARFRISLAPLGDEKNKANNFKDIYVEVLDGRQKILLLANSPHPDIAAIKQLIEINKNYEMNVAFAGEPVANLSKYDLVILHNLPSEKFPVKNELSQLSTRKTPVYFILGMQTSLPLFNQAQDLISISGNSKNVEEIQVETSPSFTTYTISESLKSAIKGYPPLLTPFGEYKIKSNASVFSYQTIKKIKTNYPQLVLGESKGSRTAIFCGEGMWKWRLVDFVQTKTYESVSELLNKSMQWTTIKDDKRKFRVNPGKTSYKENEPILVEAQLYNDNYELINEPDAALIIKSEDNKEYSYTFSKAGKSYSLNAGMFPPGNYTLAASVQVNNRLERATNKFTVEAIDLEKQDQVARHDLLEALVKKYGGKVFYPENADSLAYYVQKDNHLKPTIFQSNLSRSVIHLKWLCFVLLFTLGLEWFIRRYLGSY